MKLNRFLKTIFLAEFVSGLFIAIKEIFGSKKTIIESYKKEKIENHSFISNDKYNSNILKKNILKFY